MSDGDRDSLNGFDIEESLEEFEEEEEIHPTEYETTSTTDQETIDEPDTSTFVPVPEIRSSEENLDVVPSLAPPLFEQLVDAGQISSAETAYLKAKFDSLKDLLESEMERERRQEATVEFYDMENQRLQEELRLLDVELTSGESKEVVKLRRTLLAARNAISLSEYRTAKHQQDIEKMEEKKEALDIEYTEMCQKQDDMQLRHDLKEACADLRKEIIQQRSDIESLKDILQESSGNVITNASKVLELQNQEKLLALDEVAISGVPRDLARQGERLLRYQSEQMKLLVEADAQLSETNSHVTETQQKLNAVTLEKKNLQNDFSKLKDEAFSWEKKVVDIAKRHGEARNEDIFLAENKADLLMKLQYSRAQRRLIRHMNFQIANEIDQNVKQVRLEERHVNVIQETCLPLTDLLYKLNRELSTMPSRKVSTEKMKALQREILKHLDAKSKQENMSKETKMLYDESLVGKQRLQSELDKEFRQLHELIRKTTALNHLIEREAIKIREALLKGKRLKSTADLKTSQVEDMKKILQNTNQKAADVQRMTEAIKGKGIHLWQLDDKARHKIYEMKERMGLLAAEVHVLAEKAASFTEHLENEQSKVSMETEEYHRLRLRIISERLHDLRMADGIEKMEIHLDRLRRKVYQWATELLDLQRRYKPAVMTRNKRGIELAERNEEMCILYERINVQTKAIDEAELALRRKVDEISSLQVKVVDERRSLELVRRAILEHDWHVREIYKLSEQLCKQRERLVQLEEEYGDTESESRVRFLKGTDADPMQMKMKREHLEIRFSRKEAQVKEKQLVLRRIDQLIDGTKKKLNFGKVEALFVASHVNQLQRNLKRVNRRMMASVAELSIYRAEQFTLSKTIGDLQTSVLQEFPSSSYDQEEEDTTVDRQRSTGEDCDRAEQIMHAEAIFMERYMAASKEMSSLNQRPNAYLSDPMELSLPRPYGACGPFMPAKPAPTMRYFRKPNRSDFEC